MDNALLLSKFSVVLTVIYAGLNIHQVTSSYEYLLSKAAEFRSILAEAEGIPKLARLNIFFYVVLPFSYLLLLSYTGLPNFIVVILAIKFITTALLDIWFEKRILTEKDYTITHHNISRMDNLLNIGAAVMILWIIVYGFSGGKWF